MGGYKPNIRNYRSIIFKKTFSDLIATYRAVKDPENRARILQREKQKLERARKMGKSKVIVMDEHRKNEWKLKERQRPHEPFDDETLSEIEIQRDEYAAQVAAVYNAQDPKYERRVKAAKEALEVLKDLAPELVPEPSIHLDMIKITGPSFSLPVTDFLEMKAPLGHSNLYEE